MVSRVLGRYTRGSAGRLFTGRTAHSVDGLLVSVCDSAGRDRLLYNLGGAASTPFASGAWDQLRPGLRTSVGDRPPVHTSIGHPREAEAFCRELAAALPWPEARCGLPDASEWTVSLQQEGASAVNVAVQLLRAASMERDARRRLVAVAPRSYHGPRDASPGSAPSSLQARGGRAPTPWQTCYPLPQDGDCWVSTAGKFEHWASQHAAECAAVLFEPQWGSSRCAATWDPRALRACVEITQRHGARAVCDEIMCGLGRHGRSSVFLSTALGIEPDAIIFGKGIAAGVHPLSGAVFRSDPTGGIGADGGLAPHCHTYAGASAAALRMATATLRVLPSLYPNIIARGAQCKSALRRACGDRLTVRGQGLLWGAEWTADVRGDELRRRQRALMAACDSARVWPYFVERGFMVTPPLDAVEEQLHEALARLEYAVRATA